MNKEATLNIYEIRCKINCDYATGKITKEEKEKLEKYLELDRKEKQYSDNSEKNFINELHQLFKKWDLYLYGKDLSINGRIEILNNKLKKSFYWGKGINLITQKEINWLPKISKRREIFDKIKLNQSVKIEDVRPILKAITNLDVTEKDYKQMIEALKEKYNL